MTDDYEHLPVAPDELQDELYEAHGGRPSSEAVGAAVEALEADLPDVEADQSESDPPTPAETVDALTEIDDCPLCDAPLPVNGLPSHLVEQHS